MSQEDREARRGLAQRLRQAVQGCTVHLHGPVQAWHAVMEAGDGYMACGVVEEAIEASAIKMRELREAGVSEQDPRYRKEVLTVEFLRTLQRGVSI